MSKKKLKRITVKIGTRVLTGTRSGINRKTIGRLADEISALMSKGIDVVVVSSGAIGAGLGLMKLERKHRSLSELQAVASIGQNHLMDVYNENFNRKGFAAGQILLTQDDFNDRKRFLNIRYTLNTLLRLRAVPVINENDSVATDEIRCGDNDRLSGLVADLADSDMLIILTDVEGLYDGKGKVIKHVGRGVKIKDDLAGFCRKKVNSEGTGGMVTKLEAVRNVVKSGIPCVIAHGGRVGVITDIVEGKERGTRFDPSHSPMRARKRWIAFGPKAKGTVRVDEGACNALLSGKKSLLPSGITEAHGKFKKGDVIDILDHSGTLVAKGLANYSAEEVGKIKGKRSDKIKTELGYKDYDEVVHRDNLVILE